MKYMEGGGTLRLVEKKYESSKILTEEVENCETEGIYHLGHCGFDKKKTKD